MHSVPTPGGTQDSLCINEPGLYGLIFKSRKTETNIFKRWISIVDGKPWFVAKDVCDILEYVNSSQAISDHVDKADISNRYIPIFSNNYTLINESGLYSLIIGSKKVEAKKFRHFVTAEVLPQINKTGAYNPNPNVVQIDVTKNQPEVLLLAANLATQVDDQKAAIKLQEPLVK